MSEPVSDANIAEDLIQEAVLQSAQAIAAAKELTWHNVGVMDDFTRDGGACVLVNGQQIAVFHVAHTDGWYATDNLCPHRQQMAIGRGMVGTHGADCEPKVACPFHKKTFSLIDGRGLSDERFCIATYEVKIEGDALWLLA